MTQKSDPCKKPDAFQNLYLNQCQDTKESLRGTIASQRDTIEKLSSKLLQLQTQNKQKEDLLRRCKLSLLAADSSYGRFFMGEGYLPNEKYLARIRKGALFSMKHAIGNGTLSAVNTKGSVPYNSRNYLTLINKASRTR